MITNSQKDNHQHISYDDIEKYLNLSNESLSEEDWNFIETFDASFNTCEICVERFRTHFFLSPMIDELAADYVDKLVETPNYISSISAGFEVAANSLFNKISDMLALWGGTLLDIADYLILPQPALAFGLKGMRCGDGTSLEDAKQIVTIITNPNEPIFTIELAERQGDALSLPIISLDKTEAGKKYRLYVWNADAEPVAKPKEYNFEQMVSEEGKIYAIYVTAPDLEAGTYKAVVSEVSESD